MPSEPTRIVSCDDLADDLAASDELLLSPEGRAHVAECLRCQAELANYRRLRRAMRSLANRPVEVDQTLEHAILFAIHRDADRLVRRVPARAAATIGGLAAAAGVIALATRQRRHTRLAG